MSDTNNNSETKSAEIDLLIKEDEKTLRSIIQTSNEVSFGNDVNKENLLSFMGSKIGKIYKDLMMKLTIQKMDLYSLHTNFQDHIILDTNYKSNNDLDKLNIRAEITDFKNHLGTIQDYKNNLK